MSIHFSKHAFDRVRERLQLSSWRLEELFEKFKTVPLGIETSSNRSHDLFFSVKDNACFVAVRDVNDGTIVTIVPAEWHNKWRISIEAMTEAKRLAKNEQCPPKNGKVIINDAPSKLKARGHINYRIINLGGLEIEKYSNALIAAKDPEAVETIMHKAMLKGIDIKTLDKISINDGGKSEFIEFLIDDSEDKIILHKS
jgi:hypothetical protein